MLKKYFSGYTGEQIDEAVGTIVENKIKLADLSPELVAEIKKWIKEAEEEVTYITFESIYSFPNVGQENHLYVAKDKQQTFLWEKDHYVPMQVDLSYIESINCGGAE